MGWGERTEHSAAWWWRNKCPPSQITMCPCLSQCLSCSRALDITGVFTIGREDIQFMIKYEQSEKQHSSSMYYRKNKQAQEEKFVFTSYTVSSGGNGGHGVGEGKAIDSVEMNTFLNFPLFLESKHCNSLELLGSRPHPASAFLWSRIAGMPSYLAWHAWHAFSPLFQ